MELIPIKKTIEENEEFLHNPDCSETLHVTIGFFNKVGFEPPWIGYYAKKEGQLVGGCAFKGKPVNNQIEIAYGTFDRFGKQGIGAAMCGLLVELARKTDPTVKITARTLPVKNYSTRILEKNGFQLLGPILDPDDGEVWEWLFKLPAP